LFRCRGCVVVEGGEFVEVGLRGGVVLFSFFGGLEGIGFALGGLAEVDSSAELGEDKVVSDGVDDEVAGADAVVDEAVLKVEIVDELEELLGPLELEGSSGSSGLEAASRDEGCGETQDAAGHPGLAHDEVSDGCDVGISLQPGGDLNALPYFTDVG